MGFSDFQFDAPRRDLLLLLLLISPTKYYEFLGATVETAP